jgi:hypothetical protein
LQEVGAAVQEVLREYRKDGYAIGYIAGPVSCDGEDQIVPNLRRLVEARTAVMHARVGERALFFTAPFIFTPDVYRRLGLFDLDPAVREKQLRKFWDVLLESGFIDEISVVDGWPRSPGTQQEHETAQRLGLRINYLQSLN